MSLVEDLLEPLGEEKPAGKDVTYGDDYAQIGHLRNDRTDGRAEPEAEPIVELATKILAEESKDLTVALWLAESLLVMEGFAGFRTGLGVVHGILDGFWEHAFPEEEEDRAYALDFLNAKAAPLVAFVGVTDAGHNLFHYEEWAGLSKDVFGGEAAAGEATDEPQAGNFEAGFRDTGKARYKEMVEALDGCGESLTALEAICKERFTGKIKPHYRDLKTELERARRALDALLAKKLEADPDPPEPEEAFDDEGAGGEAASGGGGISLEPTSLNDAGRRIGVIARFMRQSDPTNPAAYLLLRGFRWGEIRAHGDQIDVRMLDAPAPEVRKRLKTLLLNEDWANLLEAGEEVTASPSGRGWLDLQRYILTALGHLGSSYAPAADAVRGQLAALLQDLPDLPQQMLMDDTPAANRDTLEWLNLLGLGGEGADASSAGSPNSGPDYDQERTLSEATHEKALEWVASGNPQRGIELLERRADHEKSVRARFITQTLAASVMIDAGLHGVAKPILKDLETTIEKHHLEDWEAGDIVARPLALLYRCLPANDAQLADLHDRICLLDSAQAFSLTEEQAPPAPEKALTAPGHETIEPAQEIEDAPGIDPRPSDEG